MSQILICPLWCTNEGVVLSVIEILGSGFLHNRGEVVLSVIGGGFVRDRPL
jgi:hypothetical protein